MTEAEMMQRVVAILTQAKEMSEASDEEVDSEQYEAQAEMVGQFIVEAMSVDPITLNSADPQSVANAVASSLQGRIGMLVACFSAAFVRLGFHHDNGDADISSVDVLRRLALEFQADESE